MATPTFIQQVRVENANTYWSYWYTNPTNWSNWESPRITLTSTLTGDTPLKIAVSGSINTDPYVHVNDGLIHNGITNAAGIYLAGSSNGYVPGATTRVALNLPNGTLLNSSASWGALLIGNPEIGWTSVFDATSGNGLGSSNPSSTLSINTSLNKLIGRTLPSGTVLYLTYNDQDNSNLGSYTVSIIDATSNPSLSLASSTTAVNEGSVAVFTLTTSNVESGTSVPYTLSGISAADVSGGLLSGNAVVNSSGIAIISVTLLNDALPEGSETLNVNAGGAIASTVINDTSIAAATYFLSPSNTSVNEGANATFTLTTTNVASGTSVPYTLSGISTSDVSGGALSGTAFVRDGIATIWVSLLNDSLTEGAETLTVSAGGATASTTVNDTSKTPTYSITASSSTVNEGATATFIVSTTNIPSGASVLYTLSGISGADVSSGYLVGSTTVNSSGQGTITIPLLSDSLTEGPETLTIKVGNGIAIPDYSVIGEGGEYAWVRYYSSTNTYLVDQVIVISLSTVKMSNASTPLWAGQAPGFWVARNVGGVDAGIGRYYDPYHNIFTVDKPSTPNSAASASLIVNDTSNAEVVPSYSLAAASSSVNEGSTATFTLATTNVASGTSVPYTLSGISAGDVSGGSLSGNAVVNSSGVATISVTLLNDSLTEGSETLTVTAGGATASTVVNDTSKTPSATYSISSNSSVNEGSAATFTLTTTNVASGTSVPYTISGISAADVSGGSLSGNAVVNSSGVATISVTLLNDSLTEGSETLIVSAGGASASTVIYDTSKSPSATYSVSENSSSVNEGSIATFTLTTTNVASGTSVPYTISGISAADVSGGSLSGNAVVNSNGIATISVALLSDSLTEGPETLTVTAGGASASTKINDTSLTQIITYTASTTQTSASEGSIITVSLYGGKSSSGATVYYELYGSGITSSDFNERALTGSLVVNTVGYADLSLAIANDLLTEGDERFIAQFFTDSARTSSAGLPVSVLISDTSRTLTLVASSSSVNEGSIADFMVTTTGVAAGSSISYTLSGVSSADITGGTLSGVATVNSIGSATISIPIAADSFTEGSETLTVTVQGKTASTIINDTSTAAVIPTYALAASSTTVSEGAIAAFTLTTTGVAPGASVSYTISGVSAADVTGGLSGTATVDTYGLATISVAVAADFLTEGTEILTVTSQGKSASISVNDTSKATAIASYALSASTNSVDEGSNAVFTLTTTNVAGGTSIAYTVSGVSAADITGGALSGTAIVNSSGTATISIPIAADMTTEGVETLTVLAQGNSASITVNDTSKSLSGLVASSTSVDEGKIATFVLTNVAPGTSIAYTLSGVEARDISATNPIGSTSLAGGAGDDTLMAVGYDSIYGGAGVDTVVYAYDKNDYQISKNPTDGSYSVIFKTGTVGYVASDVEKVKFRDTTVDLTTYPFYGNLTPVSASAVSSVYRFFNALENVFFYTNTTSERDAVFANSDVSKSNVNEWPFVYQGSTFEAAHSYSGTVTIQRFYNTLTHSHFYSCDPVEIANIKAKGASGEWPFVFEGPAFLVYASDPNPNSVGREVPVERFYSATFNRHWLTSDPDEIAQIMKTGLWTAEGIAFWTASAEQSAKTPI